MGLIDFGDTMKLSYKDVDNCNVVIVQCNARERCEGNPSCTHQYKHKFNIPGCPVNGCPFDPEGHAYCEIVEAPSTRKVAGVKIIAPKKR